MSGGTWLIQLWLVLLETLPIDNRYLYVSIFVGNAENIWLFAIAIGMHMITSFKLLMKGVMQRSCGQLKHMSF